MSVQIGQAYPLIVDKSGNPLDNGIVYIGESGQNPENYPIQIYFDEAFTIPAPQPLSTVNGYFSRNGSPAKIFIDGTECSIVVKDKLRILQWLDLNYTGIISGKGIKISTSDVNAPNGKTQEEINNDQKLFNERTIYLSDYITSTSANMSKLNEFLQSDANKVYDVDIILIAEKLTLSSSANFNGATIRAIGNFNTKDPMLEIGGENVELSNVTLDAQSYNLRGLSVNKSGTHLRNITVKNTQYIGIEGNEEVVKTGIVMENITLENVCTTGNDLGYGGITFDSCMGGYFSNIKMKDVGGKGFRLRHSNNNVVYGLNCDNIYNDQGALYLATGNNNLVNGFTCINTRNPLKLSRGERNSTVSKIDIDSTFFVDSVFSVCIMLQGTYNCSIYDAIVKKGNGYSIRVEPHPAETGDPEADQASMNNILRDIKVTSIGNGYGLYLTRGSTLQRSVGNKYYNITIDGGLLHSNNVQLQRQEDMFFDNIKSLNSSAYDLVVGEATGAFSNCSFLGNSSTSRHTSITGSEFLNISFSNCIFSGSNTSDRGVNTTSTVAGAKINLTGNTFAFPSVTSDACFFAGTGGLFALSNVSSGKRWVVGNTLTSGLVNGNKVEGGISTAGGGATIGVNY